MDTTIPTYKTKIILLIILSLVFVNKGFSALRDGDSVRATENLKIRSSGSLSGTHIDTASSGATGEIIDGPVSANGYVWWRINWDGSYDTGWSVADYLVEITPAPEPSISSVSPDPMEASSSRQTMTINGSNFVNGATLRFRDPGGTYYNSNSSYLTYISSTKLRYQIDNDNDVGSWKVKVTNPDGQDSSYEYFDVEVTQTAPEPSISSVSPDPMEASSSRQTMTINGSNFVNGATLRFRDPGGTYYDSHSSYLTYVSSTKLKYEIDNDNDAGAWRVKVENPDGQDSSYEDFTVVATAQAPSISKVDPVPASTSRQTLTIYGSNFVSGATLRLRDPGGTYYDSNSSYLTYVSSTKIKYEIDNDNDAGTWQVKVENPDGQDSSYKDFTVVATAPAPSISQIDPVPASTSRQTLTIYGSNFVNGATLRLRDPGGTNYDSKSSYLTYVSSTKIKYEIDNDNDAGTWQVKIENPDGQESSYENFTVVASTPAPSISHVDPVPASTSRQTLTIYGSNFVSGATLRLRDPGGANYDSKSSYLTYVSSTKIKYEIDNDNDAGTWQVKVGNPDGQESSYVNFTVVSATQAPSISTLSPVSMPADSELHTLTINGDDFDSSATLTFKYPDGTTQPSSANKLTYMSPNKIMYQVNNAGDAGIWQVQVNNSDGQSSGWKGFTVVSNTTPPPSDFYLSFPLPNRTEKTVKINSVFDHVVTDTDVIVAYTGEQGERRYGVIDDPDTPSYKKSNGKAFKINGNYDGAGTPAYLSYDAHRGFDFKTTDQGSGNGQINVLAAAPGILTWRSDGYNGIEIDHQNGYKTFYLHLSHRTAGLDGKMVSRGQVIGISGAVGSAAPHLHFSVWKNDIPVDPYGWEGSGVDPYTAANNINLWGFSDAIGEPASLGVIWNPSQNFNNRPNGQNIDSIVIHTVQGSYSSGITTLTNSSTEFPVSAHYIISPTGEITQLVSLDKRAWHATYYNDRSIGIEMAGYAENASTWNDENLAALEQLVAYLAVKYNIPVSHPTGNACDYPNGWFTGTGIMGHSQIQSAPCFPRNFDGNTYPVKSDPGDFFPWSSFIQNVQAKVAGGVDSVKPTIQAFSVPSSLQTLGGSYDISYAVSDTGGSGLNRVELWRTIDDDGSPKNGEWVQVTTHNISGNGPLSDNFTESPTTAGSYWYGIHVVDTNGNLSTESEFSLGPRKVILTYPLTSELVGSIAVADPPDDPSTQKDFPVTITKVGGGNINPTLRTWIIIHGRSDSTIYGENQWADKLASAIQKNGESTKNDQILFLDWRDAAYAEGKDFSQEDRIEDVATEAVRLLVGAGFKGNMLNLVGHSWGANVSAEIGERILLRDGSTYKSVRSIIALDPARNPPLFGGDYDPDKSVNFGSSALISWAFRSSTVAGNPKTPETANEAFAVYTLQNGAVDPHSAIKDIVTDILANPSSDLGQLFILERLVNSSPSARPWFKDQYKWDGDTAYLIDEKIFEASILAEESGEKAWALYYQPNSGGAEVTVRHTVSSVATYRISPSAGSNGEINPSIPTPVNTGGHVSFTATPASGYTVDKWLVNGVASQTGGNSYTLSNVTADKKVQVIFKVAEPEIAVEYGGTNITDGDHSPSAGDGTDFGSINYTSGSVSRTFRVSNTGGSTLTLGTETSSNDQFTVNGLKSSISGGSYDDFTVVFDPGSAGVKTATISFTTNDSDENPFNFTVSGEGIAPPPEIAVSGGGINISDGDSSPSSSDGTDFGSQNISNGSVARTFQVRNNGGRTLVLGLIKSNDSEFVVSGLASSIPPDGSDTFTIIFNPDSVGTKQANISFLTNVSNKNPFDFVVRGVGAVTLGTPATFSTAVTYKMELPTSFENAPKVKEKGLPKGLKLDKKTGMISGVPSAAGSFEVVVSAPGVETETMSLTIDSLPEWAMGRFSGWVDTEEHGPGIVDMNVSSNGRIAGRLQFNGSSYSFRESSYFERASDGSYRIHTEAGKGKESFSVSFSVYPPSEGGPALLSYVDGTLFSPYAGSAELFRRIWDDTGAEMMLEPYIGYYTAALPGGEGFGSGYLTFTIDEKGSVRTAGSLADGTKVSASGSLIYDPDGKTWIPLYFSSKAYQGGGLYGLVEFAVIGSTVVVKPLDDLDLLWQSYSESATGSYGEGFYRLLGIEGGWYDQLVNLQNAYAEGLVVDDVELPIFIAKVKYPDGNRLEEVSGVSEASPEGLVLAASTKGLSAPKSDKVLKDKASSSYDFATDTNQDGEINTSALSFKVKSSTGIFSAKFNAWYSYDANRTSDKDAEKLKKQSLKVQGILLPVQETPEESVVGSGYYLWRDAGENNSGKSYKFNRSFDFLLLDPFED